MTISTLVVESSAIVVVNPHKCVTSNSDAVLSDYAAEYRNTADSKTPLGLYIFQLANNAYFHMCRTMQDQCIVLIGETGSEKSENRRLAIKSLLELSVSNPGKKGSKLSSQIPAAEFVLESFGSARTLFNPNASRFGKYTELQFTERGRFCGIKTLDYYLERSRVAGAPSGERNFHIFYYLVAGASAEERQHLHLTDRSTFRYLGQRQGQGIITRQNEAAPEDATRFEQLKVALKSVGMSKRQVAQTCQLLAAILHLGNLEFTIDRHRNEDAAMVRNTDVLEIVAEFLGVQPQALETALSCKVKLVKKELCTVFLDPEGASDNRDDLAKMLYSLLLAWLNESINQRFCRDDFATFIGLFDLPGPQNMPTSASRSNSLDQFCINFAIERLQNWVQKRMFESHVTEYEDEGVLKYVPQMPYLDNSECVRLMSNMPGGLIHIMDDQARRVPKKNDYTMVEAFSKRWGNHTSFKAGGMDRYGFPTFTINYYNGPSNRDSSPPRDEETIVAAQQPVKPMRAPSTRRKSTIRRSVGRNNNADEEEKEDDDLPTTSTGGVPCMAGEFRSALDTLFATLDETQPWYVFCVNPNDSQLLNQMEGRAVKGQVRSSVLSGISKRCVNVFEASMIFQDFLDRYNDQLNVLSINTSDLVSAIEQTRSALGLQDRDVVIGEHKVFLSQAAFHKLEDRLRTDDVEEQKRNKIRAAEAEAGLDPRSTSDPYGPYSMFDDTSPPIGAAGYNDPFAQSNQALPLVANASPFQRADLYNDEYEEHRSTRSDDFDGKSRFTSQRDESVSNLGSESYAPSRNMFQDADKGVIGKEVLPGEIMEGETTEDIKESAARRRWMILVWLLTFWCPDFMLSWLGGMKRLDVRQAWREKLAKNMIIWFICACAAFVIAVLGQLICPTQHVFNAGELQSHSPTNNPNNIYTKIRGEVFDLTNIISLHERVVSVVPVKTIQQYGGLDATNLFPVQVSALCNGYNGPISPYVVLSSKNDTDQYAQYHDFRAFTTDYRPDWLTEVQSMASSGSSAVIYRGLVYDVTDYVNNGPAIRAPNGETIPGGIETQFMHPSIIDIFKQFAGSDVTNKIDALDIGEDVLDEQRTCLRNLFTIGKQDNRNDAQCLFSTYILLALSIILVSVIGFKFLAAISFAAPRAPEDHDKFVLCQVPCYTEGEGSLRRTIDSLAKTRYDDKRKLIFIICDGMIVGSGNDRPTPRIVLDILGSDPNIEPEPLSFLSLGEGSRQHNMGKVYSGLYECSGHVVPYVVIVKVGKPTERSRPGNRGKRDSQMLLMHFFNKVHFNTPMNPLELEMYHQIKNVIVNPSFYEYLFTVDADTTVDPMSLNRLVSAMVRDKKVIGTCGETGLSNSKHSIITMMQVYEYYISHHLVKAFESLWFGYLSFGIFFNVSIKNSGHS